MKSYHGNQYILRHIDGPALAGGGKTYSEDFYLYHQMENTSIQELLQVLAYGECVWYNGHQMKKNPGRHSYWSFEFVTGGAAHFVCNGKSYDLSSGDLFIMKPESEIILKADSDKTFHKRCLLVNTGLFRNICEGGFLSGTDVVRPDDPTRIKEIFDSIRGCILNPDEYQTESLGVQSYALLTEINRLLTPCPYPLPLRQALELINSVPLQDCSLSSLSRKCKVSVSTLSRLFRRHLHSSPAEYIINRRLQQAEILISLNNMTLKEIAGKCGYNSESFLSRSFKKKFGISPGKFRRS